MARVPLNVHTRTEGPGLPTRILLALARRRYGRDLDNALALSHRPPLLRAWGRFELSNARLRSVLPGHLGELVVFVAAVRVGCSWCVDFGASSWEKQGLDGATLAEAVCWRESTVFDDGARAAFEYAEAVCADPVAVDDDLVERVRGHFGDAGLVEITYWAALENLRSRFNSALGLTSQGFSSGEACSLALAAAASGRATPAGG